MNGQRQTATVTVAGPGWTFTKAISDAKATQMLTDYALGFGATPKEEKKK